MSNFKAGWYNTDFVQNGFSPGWGGMTQIDKNFLMALFFMNHTFNKEIWGNMQSGRFNLADPHLGFATLDDYLRNKRFTFACRDTQYIRETVRDYIIEGIFPHLLAEDALADMKVTWRASNFFTKGEFYTELDGFLFFLLPTRKVKKLLDSQYKGEPSTTFPFAWVFAAPEFPSDPTRDEYDWAGTLRTQLKVPNTPKGAARVIVVKVPPKKRLNFYNIFNSCIPPEHGYKILQPPEDPYAPLTEAQVAEMNSSYVKGKAFDVAIENLEIWNFTDGNFTGTGTDLIYEFNIEAAPSANWGWDTAGVTTLEYTDQKFESYDKAGVLEKELRPYCSKYLANLLRALILTPVLTSEYLMTDFITKDTFKTTLETQVSIGEVTVPKKEVVEIELYNQVYVPFVYGSNGKTIGEALISTSLGVLMRGLVKIQRGEKLGFEKSNGVYYPTVNFEKEWIGKDINSIGDVQLYSVEFTADESKFQGDLNKGKLLKELEKRSTPQKTEKGYSTSQKTEKGYSTFEELDKVIQEYFYLATGTTTTALPTEIKLRSSV